MKDEYIAEASVVIPRYLIVHEKKKVNTSAEDKKSAINLFVSECNKFLFSCL